MSSEFKDTREKSPNFRYVKLNRDKIGQGGQKKYLKHMIQSKELK